MDLAAARGADKAAAAAEKGRFLKSLAPLLAHDGPKLLVTDSQVGPFASALLPYAHSACLRSTQPTSTSTTFQPPYNHLPTDSNRLQPPSIQAIDIVHPWTLDPATGAPLVPITTFSIAMAHRQSGGRLSLFVDGLRALIGQSEGQSGVGGAGSPLSASDHVLIAEACNHNRITSDCNDIGMVQLPAKLRAMCGGGGGPVIEHAFGREYPDLEGGVLGKFKVGGAACGRSAHGWPGFWGKGITERPQPQP
jgi:hypothetical protein